MPADLAPDLVRLGVAVLVLWGGARTLRWLEKRRPAGASADRDRATVHRLWFLAPSLVMSILFFGFWWRSPTLLDVPLILCVPAGVLALGFEALRRAGLASDHPVALVLGNVISVAALWTLPGLVASLGPNVQWGFFSNPQSPAETLRWAAAISTVGCGPFLLPCMLVARVLAGRKRRAG